MAERETWVAVGRQETSLTMLLSLEPHLVVTELLRMVEVAQRKAHREMKPDAETIGETFVDVAVRIYYERSLDGQPQDGSGT